MEVYRSREDEALGSTTAETIGGPRVDTYCCRGPSWILVNLRPDEALGPTSVRL